MFQSLTHVDFNLKPQFLIKSGYYIVPSPSTALIFTVNNLPPEEIISNHIYVANFKLGKN